MSIHGKLLKVIFGCFVVLIGASAFAGEEPAAVEKKDSFSEKLTPADRFYMATAVEDQWCPSSGEIGVGADGLILSCQSGHWKAQSQGVEFGGSYSVTRAYTGAYAGCRTANLQTGGCSCPPSFSARLVSLGAINMYWLGDNYVYGYTCEK